MTVIAAAPGFVEGSDVQQLGCGLTGSSDAPARIEASGTYSAAHCPAGTPIGPITVALPSNVTHRRVTLEVPQGCEALTLTNVELINSTVIVTSSAAGAGGVDDMTGPTSSLVLEDVVMRQSVVSAERVLFGSNGGASDVQCRVLRTELMDSSVAVTNASLYSTPNVAVVLAAIRVDGLTLAGDSHLRIEHNKFALGTTFHDSTRTESIGLSLHALTTNNSGTDTTHRQPSVTVRGNTFGPIIHRLKYHKPWGKCVTFIVAGSNITGVVNVSRNTFNIDMPRLVSLADGSMVDAEFEGMTSADVRNAVLRNVQMSVDVLTVANSVLSDARLFSRDTLEFANVDTADSQIDVARVLDITGGSVTSTELRQRSGRWVLLRGPLQITNSSLTLTDSNFGSSTTISRGIVSGVVLNASNLSILNSTLFSKPNTAGDPKLSGLVVAQVELVGDSHIRISGNVFRLGVSDTCGSGCFSESHGLVIRDPLTDGRGTFTVTYNTFALFEDDRWTRQRGYALSITGLGNFSQLNVSGNTYQFATPRPVALNEGAVLRCSVLEGMTTIMMPRVLVTDSAIAGQVITLHQTSEMHRCTVSSGSLVQFQNSLVTDVSVVSTRRVILDNVTAARMHVALQGTSLVAERLRLEKSSLVVRGSFFDSSDTTETCVLRDIVLQDSVVTVAESELLSKPRNDGDTKLFALRIEGISLLGFSHLLIDQNVFSLGISDTCGGCRSESSGMTLSGLSTDGQGLVAVTGNVFKQNTDSRWNGRRGVAVQVDLANFTGLNFSANSLKVDLPFTVSVERGSALSCLTLQGLTRFATAGRSNMTSCDISTDALSITASSRLVNCTVVALQSTRLGDTSLQHVILRQTGGEYFVVTSVQAVDTSFSVTQGIYRTSGISERFTVDGLELHGNSTFTVADAELSSTPNHGVELSALRLRRVILRDMSAVRIERNVIPTGVVDPRIGSKANGIVLQDVDVLSSTGTLRGLIIVNNSFVQVSHWPQYNQRSGCAMCLTAIRSTTMCVTGTQGISTPLTTDNVTVSDALADCEIGDRATQPLVAPVMLCHHPVLSHTNEAADPRWDTCALEGSAGQQRRLTTTLSSSPSTSLKYHRSTTATMIVIDSDDTTTAAPPPSVAVTRTSTPAIEGVTSTDPTTSSPPVDGTTTPAPAANNKSNTLTTGYGSSDVRPVQSESRTETLVAVAADLAVRRVDLPGGTVGKPLVAAGAASAVVGALLPGAVGPSAASQPARLMAMTKLAGCGLPLDEPSFIEYPLQLAPIADALDTSSETQDNEPDAAALAAASIGSVFISTVASVPGIVIAMTRGPGDTSRVNHGAVRLAGVALVIVQAYLLPSVFTGAAGLLVRDLLIGPAAAVTAVALIVTAVTLALGRLALSRRDDAMAAVLQRDGVSEPPPLDRWGAFWAVVSGLINDPPSPDDEAYRASWLRAALIEHLAAIELITGCALGLLAGLVPPPGSASVWGCRGPALAMLAVLAAYIAYHIVLRPMSTLVETAGAVVSGVLQMLVAVCLLAAVWADGSVAEVTEAQEAWLDRANMLVVVTAMWFLVHAVAVALYYVKRSNAKKDGVSDVPVVVAASPVGEQQESAAAPLLAVPLRQEDTPPGGHHNSGSPDDDDHHHHHDKKKEVHRRHRQNESGHRHHHNPLDRR